jgi:hypothetical protein
MDAGKAMDRLVASRIMEMGEPDKSAGAGPEAPPFSTDLNAAWQVADRVCDEGFRLQLDGSRIWQARFYKSAAHTLETQAFSVVGRTPAEAICLAALAVKGVKT